MEGGTLFNSGFLGSSFNWWIGQIADDSYWRDNNLPGKFESKAQVPGWGKRYKVRIIGLHDQGVTEIPSDQLPWAQIMYPVTAGGGQGGSSQTANLRQGMFVFGFFLDGQDQQVPVIMGVLGNNIQTSLATTWSQVDKVTNSNGGSLAISGFSQGKNSYVGKTKPKVPDSNIAVTKPKTAEQEKECSPPKPGVQLNEFGLDPTKTLTSQQLKDAQYAASLAEQQGLVKGTKEFEDFKQKYVADQTKARCAEANSPSSPAKPGATNEDAGDAGHLLNNADVKRQELYIEKTALSNPCDPVKSAMKSIQVAIEKLTAKINKYLNTLSSYIDAVSSVVSTIQDLIANFACEIAKYMKVIFNKIMEFIIKKINCALKTVVPIIPQNRRHHFAMIKEKVVELIKCLYTKITANLCEMIKDFLNNEVEQKQKYLQESGDGYKTNNIQMCAVEELVGSVIGNSMDDMTSGLDAILKGIDDFLSEIQDYLAQAGALVDNVKGSFGGLTGSIAAALTFENLSLDLFGCDLKPNCSISDYYTIQSGSGGQPQGQLPNVKSVDKSASNPKPIKTGSGVKFAEPYPGQPAVDYNQ